MTTERKIKLNLRPSIGDKQQQQHQQPPTKLLINHGKPNFTINRSKQKFLNGVKTEENENGFTKVILKKTSTDHNSTKLIGNGTTSMKLPLKKSSNPEVNNEFLQKRKQIYEKIEKENSLDENGYTNKIENWSNTMQTTSPIEQKSYVKNISRQLENGSVVPTAPTPTTPPPPPQPSSSVPHKSQYIQQNGNGIVVTEKRITYQKDATTDHSSTHKIPTNQNGNANFEQKTFVSFSKDLASEPNKYPDTIKVIKTVSPAVSSTKLNHINDNKDPIVAARQNEVLQELTKLKFDIEIKEDVVIKPVIRDS